MSGHILDRINADVIAQASADKLRPDPIADHPLATMMGGKARLVDPRSMYVRYDIFYLQVPEDRRRLQRIQTRCLRGKFAHADREEWKTDAEGRPYVILCWLDVDPPEDDAPEDGDDEVSSDPVPLPEIAK